MATSARSDELSGQAAAAAHKATDAAQRAAEEGVRVTKRVSDLNGRAARIGTEIAQRNAETVQHALQSGAKMAAQTERSADHFGRALGLTGESAHKAAEQSSSNIGAIL
jgi:hypothetical protein